MTWPGWGEVLPLLATLVTAVATVVGAVVAWAWISARTVSRAVERAARQSEKAAREAADGVRADVRAEVKALAEKLATNDFPHVERRIDRGLAEAHADREAMEARIGERFDRMGGRIDRVEARMGERFDRARQDRRDMEARILAAVQRRPDTKDPESRTLNMKTQRRVRRNLVVSPTPAWPHERRGP